MSAIPVKFAGTPSLWQNFADYDRAYVRQWSTADEKLTSARHGACVRVSVPEVLIRTRSAKKKKKGACDATAQVVIWRRARTQYKEGRCCRHAIANQVERTDRILKRKTLWI